jgi:hypothetical protein
VALDAEFRGQQLHKSSARIAYENDLEIVDGKLTIPDAKVYYLDKDGNERHVDIEVLSKNSASGRKESAGFKSYDRGGKRAKVDDNHKVPWR